MRLKTRVLVPALAALILPFAAQANSPYHRSSGEDSFIYLPEHAQSTRTRAEVKAEVQAARHSGWLDQLQQRPAPPLVGHGPTKTRAEVVADMRNESPADRAARARVYWGAPH